MIERGGEVARRQRNLASTRENRFREQPGDRSSLGARFPNHSSDFQSVGRSDVLVVPPDLASIPIGTWDHVHPVGAALSTRTIELVRTHGDAVSGGAMVGAVDHQDIVCSGHCPGEAQGEFIGFRTGVHEEAGVERIRQGRTQSACIGLDCFVEVAGVGVGG